MKTLKDYIKILSKGIKDYDKVIEGWVNDAKLRNNLLSDEEIAIIIERRVICESCPLNSNNARISKEYFDLFGEHYTTDRKYLHCSICACPITKKTCSLESNCGLEDYNEDHPDNIQELKWKSIKQ